MSHLQIEGSHTVHLSEASPACFYFIRNKDETRVKEYDRKPRDCSVCDECQRIMKRINKAAKMAAKAN